MAMIENVTTAERLLAAGDIGRASWSVENLS